MIGEILREGFKVWRGNVAAGIPFFLGMLSNYVILVLFLLLILGMLDSALNLAPGDVSQEYINGIMREVASRWKLLALVGAAAFLIAFSINCFFMAAGIRLCFDAIESRFSLGRAFSYARTKFLSFLAANLVVFAIVMGGFLAIVLLPVIPLVKFPLSDERIMAIGLMVILSMLIAIIYLAIVVFVFTFVPYAIIVDNLKAFEGIKKAVRTLRRGIGETIGMWAIVSVLYILYTLPFYPLKALGDVGELTSTILIGLLGSFVVAPLTSMWWILLYVKLGEGNRNNFSHPNDFIGK